MSSDRNVEGVRAKLLALVYVAMLAGCSEPPRPPLEDAVQRFSKPDDYGVICYSHKYLSGQFDCVKVRR